jgi:transcriptional regulator with XRE-family HTH domain
MELARMRRDAGLKTEQVASTLGLSQSTVSRFESGKTGIRPSDLRAILDLYRVTDPEIRGSLEELAREGRQQGWWAPHRSILTATFSTYIGLESEARRILSYEGAYVHGLLQTEDYARALLSVAKETEDVVEQRVRVRMERQRRLHDGTLRLWAIIDEAALMREIGGPIVLDGQLKALLEAGQRPNVTLQVLPFSAGAHPATTGGFTIVELDDDSPPVVYVEGLAGDIYVDGPDVGRYTLAFDDLRAIALSPAQAVQRIQTVREQARSRRHLEA